MTRSAAQTWMGNVFPTQRLTWTRSTLLECEAPAVDVGAPYVEPRRLTLKWSGALRESEAPYVEARRLTWRRGALRGYEAPYVEARPTWHRSALRGYEAPDRRNEAPYVYVNAKRLPLTSLTSGRLTWKPGALRGAAAPYVEARRLTGKQDDLRGGKAPYVEVGITNRD